MQNEKNLEHKQLMWFIDWIFNHPLVQIKKLPLNTKCIQWKFS